MSPNLNRTFPVHISMDHHTYNMNRFLLTFIIDNSLQSIFFCFKEICKDKKKEHPIFRFFRCEMGRGELKKLRKIVVIINHKKIEKCTHSSFRTSLNQIHEKTKSFSKSYRAKNNYIQYAKSLKPTKNLNFYFLIYLFLKNSNNSVVSISLCELL